MIINPPPPEGVAPCPDCGHHAAPASRLDPQALDLLKTLAPQLIGILKNTGNRSESLAVSLGGSGLMTGGGLSFTYDAGSGKHGGKLIGEIPGVLANAIAAYERLPLEKTLAGVGVVGRPPPGMSGVDPTDYEEG